MANPTLWGRTYLGSPYKGVPHPLPTLPPPSLGTMVTVTCSWLETSSYPTSKEKPEYNSNQRSTLEPAAIRRLVSLQFTYFY